MSINILFPILSLILITLITTAYCSPGNRKVHYPARLGIEFPLLEETQSNAQDEIDPNQYRAYDFSRDLPIYPSTEPVRIDVIDSEDEDMHEYELDSDLASMAGSSWQGLDLIEESDPIPNSLASNSSVAPLTSMLRNLSFNEEIIAGSSSSAKSQRNLPTYSWQKGLPRATIRSIHKKIFSHWPTDLNPSLQRKWDRYASRHLNRHPEILQGILRNDARVWQQFLKWCTPEAMERRSRKYGMPHRPYVEDKKRYMYSMSVHWMAGTISNDEKDTIVNRLSKEWGNMTPIAVQNRLATYAGRFGKIQSPEPLLSQDETLFKKAAEIIFYSSDGRRKDVHSEAGIHDILHQYSPEYSILTPEGQLACIVYDKKHRRPSAKRYHTLHSWLDDLTTDQIDYIHNAIAAHWVDQLTISKRGSYFARVNEFIEQDKQVVKKILNGNDYIAWTLAKMTAEQPQYMKSYFEYKPSNFIQQMSELRIAQFLFE